MFAKTIIDSDAFLDMPLSAQALYFHLSMRADDDGFINNPKKIQRMVGASDDDCKLLIMKRFIITFESGVIVIKHWKIHNYIQKDRYKPTIYQEEKAALIVKDNKSYTECIQDGYKMETQVRLGKVRLGKVRLGKDRLGKDRLEINNKAQSDKIEHEPIKKSKNQQYISEFEDLWALYPNKKGKDKAKTSYIKARKSGVTFEEIEQGVKNYAEECRLKKLEKQYIRHGSTWFNNKGWQDEYDLKADKPNTTKQQEEEKAKSFTEQFDEKFFV